MITKSILSIYKVNLGIKKTECVLVFSDKPSPSEILQGNDLCRRERLRDVALLTAEVGKSLARKILYCEYGATQSHGAEPPEQLWSLAFGDKTVKELKRSGLFELLLSKRIPDGRVQDAEALIRKYKGFAVDAVIALSNYSTSHTQFRDFLTRICGCRYASMPLFDVSMLEGSMSVDWKSLARRTRSVERLVNRAETIHIKTPNGTSITLSKKGRRGLSDTGILTRKGSFGNLPAGEVYLAPLEGTARGKLVLGYAPTRILSSPITLLVRDGIVREVIGEETFADQLRLKLQEQHENGNIAELGIGTNDMAKRPDNLLEAEKILGTIHIALGDNSSFGGKVKTSFHQDFVFFKPTVTLNTPDGEHIQLLRNGLMT